MATENIPSRLHSVAQGNVVTGANEILDDGLAKKQNVINEEFNKRIGDKSASTGTSGTYPYNGMGRVYLPKNMINGVNTLTQDMFYKGNVGSRVPNTNTIFVIQYDYVLAEAITIPENCILEFDGGSISGGYTITGNNTGIQAGLIKIFDLNVSLRGTLCIDGFYPQWFGAISDYNEVTKNGTDNSLVFQRLINLSQYFRGIPIKIVGRFLISNTITCIYDFYMEGVHSNTRTLLLNIKDSEVFPTSNSIIAVAANTTAFSIIGRGDNTGDVHANRTFITFGFKNIKFEGVDTENTILFEIKQEGCPARPCYIDNCEFTNLHTAIYNNPLGINVTGTTIGVFIISRCNAYLLNKFINTNNVDKPNITNMKIVDCVIEQNSSETITLYNMYGNFVIDNCLLENENTPIVITGRSNAQVTISNCYFEEVGGNPFNISGRNTELDYLTHLCCLNNYYVGRNNATTISNTYIEYFDSFRYFSGAVFSNCYFAKGVDLSGLKLSNLNDANLFSDLKELGVCGGDHICNVDILNDEGNTNVVVRNGMYGFNNTANSTFKYRTTNFIEGETVNEGENLYLSFFKKGDSVRFIIYDNMGRLTFKDVLDGEGFAIVKHTVLANTNRLYATYSKRIESYSFFASMSVLLNDDTTDILDVKIPTKTFSKNDNAINLSAIAIEGQAVLYNAVDNKPIWWNGTAWVDAIGQPV